MLVRCRLDGHPAGRPSARNAAALDGRPRSLPRLRLRPQRKRQRRVQRVREVHQGGDMKWTVEATHGGTGEELVLHVDAASRREAAARAGDSGLLVRDCYPAGRGLYKGVRVVAWVWFGVFAALAAGFLLCGFGGLFATPGNRGIGTWIGGFALFACAAALGLLVARAMTHGLRHEPAPGPRGFDVVPPDFAAPPPSDFDGAERKT